MVVALVFIMRPFLVRGTRIGWSAGLHFLSLLSWQKTWQSKGERTTRELWGWVCCFCSWSVATIDCIKFKIACRLHLLWLHYTGLLFSVVSLFLPPSVFLSPGFAFPETIHFLHLQSFHGPCIGPWHPLPPLTQGKKEILWGRENHTTSHPDWRLCLLMRP